VPGGVVDDVATVSVELPPDVTLLGLNEALAPVGSPLALRLTACAEPDVTAVVMVLVALPPWVTLVGLNAPALMLKSFGGGPLPVTATSSRYM
jgi:hypothetical protein